jgi:hypothetical protein
VLHDIALTSANFTELNCTASLSPVGAVQPGNAFTCFAMYSVQEADFGIGELVFTAEATSSTLPEATRTVQAEEPAVVHVSPPLQAALGLHIDAGSCTTPTSAGVCISCSESCLEEPVAALVDCVSPTVHPAVCNHAARPGTHMGLHSLR